MNMLTSQTGVCSDSGWISGVNIIALPLCPPPTATVDSAPDCAHSAVLVNITGCLLIAHLSCFIPPRYQMIVLPPGLNCSTLRGEPHLIIRD